MSKKYTYGHGGETAESVTVSEQMREAEHIVGSQKWNSLSSEDKKSLLGYLIMKGRIEGSEGDYYYAKGGRPKPLSDSAIKKLEGFQERQRMRGKETEGTIASRVLESEYKRRKEPKVIHTQFEEEEFEYAKGGKAGELMVWLVDMGGIVEVLKDSTYKKMINQYKKSDSWKQSVDEGRRQVFVNEDGDKVTFRKKTVYADGGMMAHGGKMKAERKGLHRKQTLEEKAMKSVGADTWFQLDKETQAGVIAELMSIGNLPQRMAKGSKVSKEFTVTFELMDGKKVTEKYGTEQEMDEGIANFYIMNDVKDAIVGGQEALKEEVKAEEPKADKPKKKGLFDVEAATPKVSKAKETAPIVHVDGLENEIRRYDELKAAVKVAEAEQAIIGGVIKDVAKEKYLEVYENQRKRPTSIIIESGGAEIKYTVLDKYKIMTPEKETVLKEYDNLLGTDYTFTFDNEILDKKGANGDKIADIINDLIENSDDIPDEYKAKLVKITEKTGVKKGTIERLLDYKNPAEIMQIIEPVTSLI